MDIVTDLAYIKEMAVAREDENWAFRAFLKRSPMPFAEIDALVHAIFDDVASQIDCTTCANCCKKVRPTLDEEDVVRFARGLKLPLLQFQEQYLSQGDETGTHKFNSLPCPFLKDNRCSNYDHRPETCRSYPHLHKDDFVFRLWGVVMNYEICPIVFNVVEQLKVELWKGHGSDGAR